MRPVLLLLEFDGTDFHGWQRQASLRTVQGVLTDCAEAMLKHEVTCRASSRTDAGVHAWALPVVIETERQISEFGLRRGLNSGLPQDISVASATFVGREFDPRRQASGKTYRYQVWNRSAPSALQARYSWQVHQPLDVDAMNAAGKLLLGEHDFSAFRSAHCDSQSTMRYMEAITVTAQPNGMVWIDISANAFLRNMARILAGTLVEIGQNKRPPDSVRRALEERDRNRAGKTAPARGLFLMEVRYPCLSRPKRSNS